ncbi:hypothetical protein MLC59_02575 [Marinobacter bryozoorum]|uniref:hypothetical protein n=1 Tax=Marinobacter bryozoorum TaxID=256324 RepID=UPI0020069BA0|nr:hypothetical protein [Marinobacter bryozoorum]MCK7543053.1 hypothetical protein [Marinobacter bryozoorum]
MDRDNHRPMEGLNTWKATAGGIEFRGMNEQSAVNRVESYLRNTGREGLPITVEPPEGFDNGDQ